jgi:hypothetical protein
MTEKLTCDHIILDRIKSESESTLTELLKISLPSIEVPEVQIIIDEIILAHPSLPIHVAMELVDNEAVYKVLTTASAIRSCFSLRSCSYVYLSSFLSLSVSLLSPFTHMIVILFEESTFLSQEEDLEELSSPI